MLTLTDDDDDRLLMCDDDEVPAASTKRGRSRPVASSSKRSVPSAASKRVSGSATTGIVSQPEDSDPFTVARNGWEIQDAWDAPTTIQRNHDGDLISILDACDRAKTDGDTTAIDVIARTVMAMNDRYAVEHELMRQITRTELYESRLRTVALLEAMRQREMRTGDSNKLATAMRDVSNVNYALRGIYPHISFAHQSMR